MSRLHLATASPEAIQDRIVEEFNVLAGEREMALQYLIEIGQRLPPLDLAYKIEENKIKGCMSSVWMRPIAIDNRLFFEADSNTVITKGLIGLLLQVWSGQLVSDIITTPLYFIGKIGLQQLVGTQRSSGLAQMILHIQQVALKFRQ
jgi:cysteine desulfuration protein SufE